MQLEVLALDTATPQIRAPGVGDTYTFPRAATIAGPLTFGTDTILQSEASNTLALRNGILPQSFHVYNKWTDASNYERAIVRWTGTYFVIGTENAGTGVATALRLQTGNVVDVHIGGTLYYRIDATGFRFHSNNPNNFGISQMAGGDKTSDTVARNTSLNAQNAWSAAVTNLEGGDVNIAGGNGASGSAGQASGGDVRINGGTGYGTGKPGNIIMGTLPTSDTGLPAGALWRNGTAINIV